MTAQAPAIRARICRGLFAPTHTHYIIRQSTFMLHDSTATITPQSNHARPPSPSRAGKTHRQNTLPATKPTGTRASARCGNASRRIRQSTPTRTKTTIPARGTTPRTTRKRTANAPGTRPLRMIARCFGVSGNFFAARNDAARAVCIEYSAAFACLTNQL